MQKRTRFGTPVVSALMLVLVVVGLGLVDSSARAAVSTASVAAFDLFGFSVAVSGDTVVVGAFADEDAGGGRGSASVFVRSGTPWTRQARLTTAARDQFGSSVAVSGDTVVVGAPADDDGGFTSGAVYVFVRSGTIWTEQAKLTASDAAAGDGFGSSVAVSGDTVVVGASDDDDAGESSGSAYLFVRSGTIWTQQPKLTASDAAAGDQFGNSVAVSGDTVVIGARGDEDAGVRSGSVYLFVRSGTIWTQQPKLTASDAAAEDQFGWSVAVSGDTVVIGARSDDDAGESSGSAYLFVRSGTIWTQQPKLTASDAAAGDQFGQSVAVSGDTVVVGAPADDDAGIRSGSVYLFVRSGTIWTQQPKLTPSEAEDLLGANSVAISGDTVVGGAADGVADRSGSAYLFVRSGTTWTLQAKLTALAPSGADTVGLVDPSQGIWYLRNSVGVVTSFFYGNPGDLPIAGDWDGDGIATPGLFRQSDGFFYARNSNTQGPADAECFAGNPSDIPIAGDWDGDGDDNLGIYRPSEQVFYLFTSTCTGSPMGAAQISFLFGNPGDKPVAGDWDGDGVDEIGLHRESTGLFYWRNTLDTGIADGTIFFGDPGDRFVSGDWGIVDGKDTPAVFRPSNTTFFFRHTLTQGNADSQFVFGQPGWLPVAGDFDLG